MIERETGCRACGAPAPIPILDFGVTPLADCLVGPEQQAQVDPLAPLELVLCRACGLAQIAHTVAAEILFGADYPYFSSVSAALLAHCRANAEELVAALALDSRSLVVEIASNDGYMLRNFAVRGIPVVGVDPAPAPAAAAVAAGIPTLNTFFTGALAAELRAERGPADLVLANNVLAHVADLNDLVAGVATLLAPRGRAVIEVPYLVDLLDSGAFDTIYHQHLCYFAVTPLVDLFDRHGLALVDVRRIAIHGGSLRLYVAHAGTARRSAGVAQLLDLERARGLKDRAAYTPFVRRVEALRAELIETLAAHAAAGLRLAGYGAAAKATTLLAYCGIGREHLDYVVDRNRFKHGRRMPGSRLPIFPVEHLLADRPDAVLLLTWNFADEIVGQQAAYLAGGGQFIVPIPALRVIGPRSAAA